MYTVIIPSLGRIDFLNDLLETIYNQTIPPKEIIILFDKNEKCNEGAKFINKKNICQIIFCNNLTTPEKRNFGVNQAKTNIILFSDDDDVWELKKAELTLESLKINQVVCHDFSKFGQLKNGPSYNLGKKRKIVSILSVLYGNNIWGGGSGISARKEILLSIPFNNDLYSEDYDWWVKILLAEIKVEYIPIPLVRCRVHKKNMTSNYLNIFKYNLKLFDKLFYKSTILFFTFIFGYFRSCVSILIKALKIVSLKIINKYF